MLTHRPLNLETLQQWVEQGRLPTDRVITMKDLRDSGCVGRKMGWGVKLLGRGAASFKVPVQLQASSECGIPDAVQLFEQMRNACSELGTWHP